MFKRSEVIFIVLFALLPFMPLVAQQAGSFTFVNESNAQIDRATVEQTAHMLVEKYNADVAVYAVVSGGSSDFWQRLEDDQLVSSSFRTTQPRVLAIYFAVEEQYSEIRWGAAFDTIDGRDIRSSALNPSLRNADFTGAVVNALNAVDSQMSDPLNGIKRLIGGLVGSGFFWVTLVAVGMVVILIRVRGIPTGSGASSTYSHDAGSSWDSGSSDSSSDSGGGSDGGSWSD